MTQPTRARLYKLLAIGKQHVCWSDGYYRQQLAAHGATEKDGRVSATTMTIAQMEAVLADMQGEGFVIKRGRKGSGPGTSLKVAKWRRSQIGKLNAIWCLLADHGHVRNRSEQAMHVWCQKKVPGLTRLEWASAEQLSTAVEALKGWGKRLGFVEDYTGMLHPPKGTE